MTEPRPRRPALFGPAVLASVPGGADPAQLAEAAHATAQLIVYRGRHSGDAATTARLVNLVDELGLETVASWWSDRPARSLPGALWRLYVLREWVRRDPAGATADYEAGRYVAHVPRVVAGAEEPPTAQGLRELLDKILGGVFHGDLDVALERAAAFCRVVAAGRAFRADGLAPDDDGAGQRLTERAASLITTAEDLEADARLWRAGELD